MQQFVREVRLLAHRIDGLVDLGQQGPFLTRRAERRKVVSDLTGGELASVSPQQGLLPLVLDQEGPQVLLVGRDRLAERGTARSSIRLRCTHPAQRGIGPSAEIELWPDIDADGVIGVPGHVRQLVEAVDDRSELRHCGWGTVGVRGCDEPCRFMLERLELGLFRPYLLLDRRGRRGRCDCRRAEAPRRDRRRYDERSEPGCPGRSSPPLGHESPAHRPSDAPTLPRSIGVEITTPVVVAGRDRLEPRRE